MLEHDNALQPKDLAKPENKSYSESWGTPPETALSGADSELGKVIAAWPNLQEQIKKAVLALIGAAGEGIKTP